MININITSSSSILPLAVSTFAVLVSIGTFYWINLRKGKIIVSDPSRYALWSGDGRTECERENDELEMDEIYLTNHRPKMGKINMMLPLTFLNEGAKTKIIQDVRVILQQNSSISKELYLIDTSLDMENFQRGIWETAKPIVLSGHDSWSDIYIFNRGDLGFVPAEGICEARVIGKNKGDTEWNELTKFKFLIHPDYKINEFKVYFSDPEIE